MDFIDKKEKFADLIENFVKDPSKKEELLALVVKCKEDSDFKGKDLFFNIFSEFERHLDELSHKELKQRVLLIRSFID